MTDIDAALEFTDKTCRSDSLAGTLAAEVRRLQAAPALVTLETAVRGVVEKHGGIRAAATATGVDKAFISRLLSGKKTAPSDETLRKLGLCAVPMYALLQSVEVQASDKWQLTPVPTHPADRKAGEVRHD